MKKSIKKPSVSTPKLKIGIVLDDSLDVPDGVQQYVLTIGQWMSRQGHEVHYIVGHTKRQDIKNIHSMSKNIMVSFNQNKMRIPYRASKKDIQSLLDSLDLDVLHVQVPYSPVLAGKVINAVSDKVRVVGTYHIAPAGGIVTIGTKMLKTVSSSTLKRFDSIISVSTAAQKFAKKTFNVDSVVIPNAVNVESFKHTPIKRKYIHIVYLGRLVERKGCIWLLKALERVQDIYLGDYKVTIASDGPLRNKLEAYVKKYNLKNVNFVGYIDESAKPKLLASADVAVFPSTGGESFGIVLVEAMAANSRVVLGGDNVGYRSVLGSHSDLLFNPKDTNEFTRILVGFMKSEPARNKAHRWNKVEINKYNVDTVGPQIIAIYKNKHKQ